MSDWWAAVRIFPPSPLEPGIPFLNHLSLYSILRLSTCNPSEGIPVPPQLVEKVVYVDMKALEEEAAVSCWRPVGARTDRKLGLIRECAWRLVALATLTLLDLNAQRTMDENEGKKKGIYTLCSFGPCVVANKRNPARFLGNFITLAVEGPQFWGLARTVGSLTGMSENPGGPSVRF